MGILQCLLGALAGWLRPRQSVRSHVKNQAYGRRWSRHRPRPIEQYTRKRHRHGRQTAAGLETVAMNHRILEDLHHATGEGLLFGIGLLALPDREPAPFIHIHYRDCPRKQLKIVRESFRAALVLAIVRRSGGVYDLHVSSRSVTGQVKTSFT